MENKKHVTGLVIALIAVVVIGIFMWSGSGYSSENGDIRIGFIGPISGDLSALGEPIVAATELAVKEINANGGVNGRNVVLIYEDGGCNAEDALSAGNKLIHIDQVDYLLTGCSSGTLAIAPIAEENEVVVMAYASSSPAISDAGDYIFRTYKNDNDAGRALAEFMDEEGISNVAVLSPLNDYAEGISGVFKTEFESLGGDVVFEELFETSLTDYRTIIAKMKDEDIDAVVLLDNTNGIIAYFEQAEKLGFDIGVYGADVFDDPKIAEVLGDLYDGAKYVEVVQSSSAEFKQKMKVETGSSSLTVGVVNGYDSVYLLARAIEAVGDDPEKVKDYLYEMPVYRGESGNIKFDENGDVGSVKYELRQIVKGKPVVVF